MPQQTSDDALHDIIRRIYEGVTEPAALATVIDDIIRWVDADSALLLSFNQSPAQGGFMLPRGIDESILKTFATETQLVDPWAAKVPERLQQDVLIVFGNELVPEQELVRTDFYQKILAPAYIHHLLSTAMRLDANRREMDVTFSLFRAIRRPAFDEACRKAMGRIADHLRRALLLAATLKQAQRRAETAESVLDHVGNGILLTDGHAHIIHATPCALSLLDTRHGLIAMGGRLAATTAGDSDLLRGLIARAAVIDGGIRAAGDMAIRRSASLHPLIVSVFPLPSSHASLRGHNDARVLIILHDADSHSVPHWELFARYYSLTPKELRLCQALADGQDIAAYCDAVCISANTARSQIKSIFAKTGTRRQSELVRLVLSFGS